MWFPIRRLLQQQVSNVEQSVNFDIYQGETLGLVEGESGCGSRPAAPSSKLYRPTGGSVLFEGGALVRIEGDHRRMRRRMQMLPGSVRIAEPHDRGQHRRLEIHQMGTKSNWLGALRHLPGWSG